jgi:hypothetical protein
MVEARSTEPWSELVRIRERLTAVLFLVALIWLVLCYAIVRLGRVEHALAAFAEMQPNAVVEER